MILFFWGLINLFNEWVEDEVDALVYAILSYCLLLFSFTELLSLFGGIKIGWLWFMWLGAAVCVWKYLIKKHGIGALFESQKEVLKGICDYKHILILAAVVGAMAVSVCIIPYNNDSMTYHLPRIMQWAQNQSVSHFATADVRALASPPMAEFIGLQIYVMTGSVHLFNLVQTVSFLGTGYLVYRLSIRLGNGKKWSTIASFLFLTTPIAFAEGFTTQVDNLAALMMICFTYLIVSYLEIEDSLTYTAKDVLKTIMIAISVGLGYITKPSICIGMVVFAIFLLIVCMKRRDSFIICLKHAVTAIPVLGVILFPEIFKNIRTFGKINPPGVGDRQLVGTLNLNCVIVNLYKTFSINLPLRFINGSNDIIKETGYKIADILKVNIDDVAIAEDGRTFSVAAAGNYGCDTANNPIIVWGFLISSIVFIAWLIIRKNKKGDLRIGFVMTVVLSYVLFCAVLRWEPFVSRYMISYFAMIAAMIACVGDMILPIQTRLEPSGNVRSISLRVAKMVYALLIIVCSIELVFLVNNQRKIISFQNAFPGEKNWECYIDNTEAYFEYKIINEYVNYLSQSKEIETIGLDMAFGCHEYPFYLMLPNRPVIRRINIDSDFVAAQYERRDFIPDLIIQYATPHDMEAETYIYNDAEYSKLYVDERMAFWERIDK